MSKCEHSTCTSKPSLHHLPHLSTRHHWSLLRPKALISPLTLSFSHAPYQIFQQNPLVLHLKYIQNPSAACSSPPQLPASSSALFWYSSHLTSPDTCTLAFYSLQCRACMSWFQSIRLAKKLVRILCTVFWKTQTNFLANWILLHNFYTKWKKEKGRGAGNCHSHVTDEKSWGSDQWCDWPKDTQWAHCRPWLLPPSCTLPWCSQTCPSNPRASYGHIWVQSSPEAAGGPLRRMSRKSGEMTFFLPCAKSLSGVWLFATPWIVAHQAPLSMGIFQERTLEWVAMPSSRGSSQPRDWTQVSRIASRLFTVWAIREALSALEWPKKALDLTHRPVKVTFLWCVVPPGVHCCEMQMIF